MRRISTAVVGLWFDRVYDLFGGAIGIDARGAVRRSAERYAASASGDLDHHT